MTKRKLGRSTKLTPEIQVLIVKAIKSGLSNLRAAQLSGISEPCFYLWKRRGEEEKAGPYHRFLEALKQAETEFIATALKRIEQAAKGGRQVKETKESYDAKGKLTERIVTVKRAAPIWTADAWLLERRVPEEFSRNRTLPSEDIVSQLADSVHSLSEIVEIEEE
jgi:hypothetical protein